MDPTVDPERRNKEHIISPSLKVDLWAMVSAHFIATAVDQIPSEHSCAMSFLNRSNSVAPQHETSGVSQPAESPKQDVDGDADGGYSLELCGPSGAYITTLQIPDMNCENIMQWMDEGLVDALPAVPTTIGGNRVQAYQLVWQDQVLREGQWLSHYSLPCRTRMTVILVDLTDALQS